MFEKPECLAALEAVLDGGDPVQLWWVECLWLPAEEVPAWDLFGLETLSQAVTAWQAVLQVVLQYCPPAWGEELDEWLNIASSRLCEEDAMFIRGLGDLPPVHDRSAATAVLEWGCVRPCPALVAALAEPGEWRNLYREWLSRDTWDGGGGLQYVQFLPREAGEEACIHQVFLPHLGEDQAMKLLLDSQGLRMTWPGQPAICETPWETGAQWWGDATTGLHCTKVVQL